VGGSSRIPKIQEMLTNFFDGKKLNSTINPDEAVAYGAAVKAALSSGEHTIEEITMVDVVPLSLGTDNCRGEMVTFIKKN
ncbi:Hsp70 family protein, partial [Xanthomonas citri pv. citri]|nr:Hsp70 family protein [Xanthomonas citri pv. citri]